MVVVGVEVGVEVVVEVVVGILTQALRRRVTAGVWESSFYRRFNMNTWKDAFRCKAICIEATRGSLGYRICFYLWSADIWFGNVPMLKCIVAINFLVWIC